MKVFTILVNGARYSVSTNAITNPTPFSGINSSVRLPNAVEMKATYHKTSLSTTSSKPCRAEVYKTWRTADSFGRFIRLRSTAVKPAGDDARREIAPLHSELYKNWRHTDSFGRMLSGPHAKKDGSSERGDSATKVMHEGIKVDNKHLDDIIVEEEAGVTTSMADKADMVRGDGIPEELASIQLAWCKVQACGKLKDETHTLCKCCRVITEELTESDGKGVTAAEDGEEHKQELDTVWGRGSYPYTRMF